MPSLLALSGLNVDRAYPELRADAADRRRSVATTLLLAAISHAQKVGADGLLIVGGLFDDRCVSPASISYIVQILDAYPGYVMIAPGADPEGIHTATDWGPRTSVWSSTDFTTAPEPFARFVRGRAYQEGSSATIESVPNHNGVMLLVGADLSPDVDASWTAGDRGCHLITSGPVEARQGGVTVLAPLNPDLGEPWGRAALLTYDALAVTNVEWVSLATQAPGQTIEVEVTTIGSTDELKAALDHAVTAAPEWSAVKLVGDLPQGVLLPSTAEYVTPRDDVALETDEVGFQFGLPEKADHTALAEFVRSLCAADADERVRHQAIALGMAALIPASNGVDWS